MSTATQHDRCTGMGGTDVAAALGVNPHRDPRTTAAIKQRLISEHVEESDEMAAGKYMEQWVFHRWLARSPLAECDYRKPDVIVSEREPWAFGSPDFIVMPGEGKAAIGVEVKCAFSIRAQMRWKEVGTDSLPKEYLVQVAWYAWLTGIEEWIILLFDGKVKEYKYTRNAELEAELVAKAREFWTRYCIGGETPEMTGMASELETLKKLYPKSEGSIRSPDAEEEMLLIEGRKIDQDFDAAKLRFEAWANTMRERIGEDEGIITEHDKVTWKSDINGVRRFVAKFK